MSDYSPFGMMSDEMKEKYLKGELAFHRGKIVIGEDEISMLEMNKGEVMSSNFERLFKMMKENDKDRRKGFSSIHIGISGWDDTPEPIYEIMPIRRFYMKLFRKMPHFLFYISPMRQIPKYIIACLSDIEVLERSGKFKAPLDLIKEEGSTKNIGSTVIEVKLKGEIGYKMIAAINDHAEKVGFVDKNRELIEVYKMIEGSIRSEERKTIYL